MSSFTTATANLRRLDEVYWGLLECENVAPLPNGLPRYLFRGERDGFPETLTSMDRHYFNASLDPDVYEELEQLTAYVMLQPFAEKKLMARAAGAYAQHYGLPTQIYDFTASAEIATIFSANNQSHYENHSNAEGGNIAILDVAKALKAGCVIEDLRTHEFARRATLQHAFGVIYMGFNVNSFYNLKDPEIMNKIGLVWVPFAHLTSDQDFIDKIRRSKDILSVDGDQFASLAQDFVDKYIGQKGRFSKAAAKILAEEIPNIGYTREQNFARWSW